MRAGKLRHRVTFEEATDVPRSSGARTKVWNEVGTRWASVDPLTGKEVLTAAQVAARVSHKITIRNRPPSPSKPAAQLRIRLAKTGEPVRIFNVESSLNWQERGIESSILATEAVGGTG